MEAEPASQLGEGALSSHNRAEHQRIEDALKASEVRYRRLFETAKDGILILDADTGQVTDANPFLEEMPGYSHAELLGKRLWEIGPFRDVVASQDAFGNYSGGSISGTMICHWNPKGTSSDRWSLSAICTWWMASE